jgi:DnaJ-domain-containing protein 1
MFERSHENRIAVVVTLTDGETLQGSLRLPLSNKLADAVNNAEPFLDFAGSDGERCFIAKHCVRKVQPFNVPRNDQLERTSKNGPEFDPHLILGLSKEADAASVKQAYHRLARSYHPDRFAGIELPREMHDYATAMLARINLAYRQLQAKREVNGGSS